MPRLKTLLKDPRGSIFWTLDSFWVNLNSWPTTFITFLIAWAWGVDLTLDSQFVGFTHFKKYPGSIIKIGKKCRFRSDFRSNMVGVNRPCGISTYSKNAQIIIGNNCGFSGTIIGATDKILIGNNILAGANVTITDFDWHPFESSKRHTERKSRSAPVVIEDNVWLGLNSLVLKGVTIGTNTIVGANAVVTSSLPANVIAAGNPAKVIRSLQIPLNEFNR